MKSNFDYENEDITSESSSELQQDELKEQDEELNIDI